LLLDFSSSGHHSSITITRLLTVVNMSLTNINASLTENNLHHQLEILGETISQEDINLKFLRSLPSEWKTHTLIWRNKADLEEQSLDDLFNTLKIYKAKVKGSSPVKTVDNRIYYLLVKVIATQSNLKV
nr:ribonuclease H-like domain-containing protein [Tanacetum cinerariifolium]